MSSHILGKTVSTVFHGRHGNCLADKLNIFRPCLVLSYTLSDIPERASTCPSSSTKAVRLSAPESRDILPLRNDLSDINFYDYNLP